MGAGLRGDAPNGVYSQRLPAAYGGFSLIEVLVVAGILSLILAAAVSRLNSGFRSAESAAAELAANLRLCRTKAVSSGYHYRVNVTGADTYDFQRMLPPTSGSTWTVDSATPTRTIRLPPNVQFATPTATYEFDTRGVVVGATAVATETLQDSALSHAAVIQIWPSGQVN